MANKDIFSTRTSAQERLDAALNSLPAADTLNQAKAPAYDFRAEHKLAQYVMTGCLNGTFYASAQEQLKTIVELSNRCTPEFIGKLAIVARNEGYMKDTPALLTAILSSKDQEVFKEVFPEVIDNTKMLRNFVQIMRSGATGRTSLGSLPKRMVAEWLISQQPDKLFLQSIGSNPSLGDIIKMVHPTPGNDEQRATFGYLIGAKYNENHLPQVVQEYISYKKDPNGQIPNVPFQMLDSLGLGTEEWKHIAKNASWSMTRQNLNTFKRHGVLEDPEMQRIIARRLANPELIEKAKAFPYQIMVAYKAYENDSTTNPISAALEVAMEHAIRNVPVIEGNVVICPDVSGSMSSPITGYRSGSSSKVECIDVAALITASLYRNNPGARILPFEQSVIHMDINPDDSVMTNASSLASIGGGGTNCSAPLRKLNDERAKVDVVIIVSDNESWIDANRHGATETMRQWTILKARNPDARLVCVDITPNDTSQAPETIGEILNVGGFSDQVFTVMDQFIKGELEGNSWVERIEQSVNLKSSQSNDMH